MCCETSLPRRRIDSVNTRYGLIGCAAGINHARRIVARIAVQIKRLRIIQVSEKDASRIGRHEAAELRGVVPRWEVMQATLGVLLLTGEVQRIRVYTVSTHVRAIAVRLFCDRLATSIAHIASGTLSTKPVRVIEIRRSVVVGCHVLAICEDFATVPSSSGA